MADGSFDDTVGLDIDATTDSRPPLSFDLNFLESPFHPSSLLGPSNGHAFAPLEGPNVGLFDFESTALGPSTDFSPINKFQADFSSPQSGTLADASMEPFDFNTPPSIGNCTSLATSPLTSLSPLSETPNTLQTWPPSNLMEEPMLFQPVDLPVYCTGFDSVPLGVLGQGNQPAIFQTPPPAFSPQSFGNVDQHGEELDQDLEAPILGGEIGQKLTKAGNLPKREQRKKDRPKKCPFPDCKFFTKGFAYQRGVDRHILDKHKDDKNQYFCPVEGCSNKFKAYGREDHLLRHLTNKHGRPNQKRGRHARK